MKKLILAVVLIALIVAVSYIKYDLRAQRQSQVFEEGKKTAGRELIEYENRVDSLKNSLGNREVSFADTMVKIQQTHQSQVDSLVTTLQSKDSVIGTLSSKLKEASKSKPTVTNKKTSKIPAKHSRIIEYYKKRYNALPKDLSSYERKVALNEIREETAQKFSISLKELDSLRSKYKLGN